MGNPSNYFLGIPLAKRTSVLPARVFLIQLRDIAGAVLALHALSRTARNSFISNLRVGTKLGLSLDF